MKRPIRLRNLVVLAVPGLLALALALALLGSDPALPPVPDPYSRLPADQRPRTIDQADYLLRLPSQLDASRKHPLVVALAPDGAPRPLVNLWTPVSEQRKWLLFGSKTVRNGVDLNPQIEPLRRAIQEVIARYPVDQRKVIVTGFSGGAMASHDLAFELRDLVAATVLNTGMMGEWERAREASRPRGKLAVFLASPTDFRYEQMKLDRQFLERLGWNTTWIVFDGGHRSAPPWAVQRAAAWLDEQLPAGP